MFSIVFGGRQGRFILEFSKKLIVIVLFRSLSTTPLLNRARVYLVTDANHLSAWLFELFVVVVLCDSARLLGFSCIAVGFVFGLQRGSGLSPFTLFPFCLFMIIECNTAIDSIS